MPPPRIERANPMPGLLSTFSLGGADSRNAAPQNAAPLQAPHDPALDAIAQNNAPVNLAPGGNHAADFAAAHQFAPASRDWDMTSSQGMLNTAKAALSDIRKTVAGADKLDELDRTAAQAAASAARLPGADADAILRAYAAFKEKLVAVKAARAALERFLEPPAGATPRESLRAIRGTMRIFRYCTQKALAEFGLETGKMETIEGLLRGIQNAFSAKDGVGTAEIERIFTLENELAEKFGDLRNLLRETPNAPPPPKSPAGVLFAESIGGALELSHKTNDQIRGYFEATQSSSNLRSLLSGISRKGGSREVEFSAGAGALIGLGFPESLTAGLRVGARVRIVGKIECAGPGRPVSATFRFAYGVEAKLGISGLQNTTFEGFKAGVSGNIENSHYTTRTYASMEDLILDAKNNRLATANTIGGVIWDGLKSLGRTIGSLGRSVFRRAGRRSGEVLQDNAAYLDTLKSRGIAGRLDTLLAKRANPVITGYTTGLTLRGSLGASASLDLGLVSGGVGADGAIERDWHVKTIALAPLARKIKLASLGELNAMMHPGPDGNGNLAIPRGLGADDLAEAFDAAIAAANELPPENSADWARFANKIRSLMLAAELAGREGTISRADADRLLSRFSNPPVAIPQSIFREYLMVGSGAVKHAKIRKFFTVKANISLLKPQTDSIASLPANPFAAAAAGGLAQEIRHTAGLDSSIRYSFSSEKPANPGEDPRPWENTVKTTHTLAVSSSLAARTFVDIIARTIVNKGSSPEFKSQNLAKDIASDVAKDASCDAALNAACNMLPGLVLAAVSEGGKATTAAWLEKPENATSLITFVSENPDIPFDNVASLVEDAATKAGSTLKDLAATIKDGSTLISTVSREKVLSWSFVDGKFDSFTMLFATSVKTGVDFNPAGVGVGVGFDLSYTVSDSVRERIYMPRPGLASLLAAADDILLADSGMEVEGNSEALKNFLSKNRKGVEYFLTTLENEDTLRIVADAIDRAGETPGRQERIAAAMERVRSLAADAAPETKIAAVQELLLSIVAAYR